MKQPALLVLGAGPAGVGAALAAAECGLETTIVDAAHNSGGQVYRPVPREFKRRAGVDLGQDRQLGDRQQQALTRSGVSLAFEHTIWSVGQDLRVDTLGPNGPQHWQPQALIVATGATERVVPFPGWTLPGVIGLAAATVLLKSQFILPGRRTLVAGCGPLLAAVAHNTVQHGGQVAAIADLASRRDWLAAVPGLLLRPRHLSRGIAWLGTLRAAGVGYRYRQGIRQIEAKGESLTVTLGRVDHQGQAIGPTTDQLSVDCVAVGHGLTPSTDITRLLRVQHHFDTDAGGWIPTLDSDQRTTRNHLYAAGDGTGIRGADAAYLQGQIAGYTAAFDLGHITAAGYQQETAALRRQLARVRRFGAAIAKLMSARLGQIADIAATTIVCRCEDVTRAAIEQALDQGAANVNQLKSWTRCGMGPCQGRICADNVAAIVAARGSSRTLVGAWTPRTPLRPLDVAAFSGHFDYADIPLPKAAPL